MKNGRGSASGPDENELQLQKDEVAALHRVIAGRL